MRLAKFKLNILTTLLMGTGLTCAQMCDFACAFPARLTASATKAKSHGGHCHQEKKQEEQSPSPSDHSNCASHSGLTALLKSGPDLASLSQGHIVLILVEPPWSQALTLDYLVGVSESNLPFRSPPGSPRLIPLRI